MLFKFSFFYSLNNICIKYIFVLLGATNSITAYQPACTVIPCIPLKRSSNRSYKAL